MPLGIGELIRQPDNTDKTTDVYICLKKRAPTSIVTNFTSSLVARAAGRRVRKRIVMLRG